MAVLRYTDGTTSMEYSGATTTITAYAANQRKEMLLTNRSQIGLLVDYTKGAETNILINVDFSPVVALPITPAPGSSVLGTSIGPDTVTGYAFTATTITRNDGGNWASDGYRTGDYVNISNAEDVANDGTFGPITVVDDLTDGAITVSSAALTVNTADTTAVFQVDYRFALGTDYYPFSNTNGSGVVTSFPFTVNATAALRIPIPVFHQERLLSISLYRTGGTDATAGSIRVSVVDDSHLITSGLAGYQT